MGWLPQEEFRGSPDRWVDAETYVRNAETQMPFMKGTLSTLERKVVDQDALLREQNKLITDMRTDFAEFVEFSRQSEARAYQQALKDIQDRQRKAVEDQDLEGFDKASHDLEEHIKSHPAVTGKAKREEPTGGPAPQVPPWMQPPPWYSREVEEQWKNDNPWYRENPKMAAYAKQMDVWDKVTELVRDEFPQYWSNPRRGAAQVVEGDTGRTSTGAKIGKTYSDLPPDAKAQCDKFCGRDGKGETGSVPGLKREDYVKDYFRGEEVVA
jgi:hypothetical protein